jgi:hypothetical protein
MVATVELFVIVAMSTTLSFAFTFWFAELLVGRTGMRHPLTRAQADLKKDKALYDRYRNVGQRDA